MVEHRPIGTNTAAPDLRSSFLPFPGNVGGMWTTVPILFDGDRLFWSVVDRPVAGGGWTRPVLYPLQCPRAGDSGDLGSDPDNRDCEEMNGSPGR